MNSTTSNPFGVPQVPSIHATFYGELLAAIRRLGPEKAVLAAGMPPPSGSWMPIRLLVDLAGAVLEADGREGLRGWAVPGCLAAMQRPLFAPYLEAAQARGGCEPAALLEFACEAARVHFAGCGEFAVESVAEDGATVVQAPLPPSLRDERYLLLTGALLVAFPVACGLEADVEARGGAGSDRAEYHLGWWVPGALER